ncbi:Bgt-50294 [Blumeria graminis f. sp. tritici]|uniref:Bgt-50294 n=1 Tax=Blumeria graminis f. sp. tritici TaxID=62690 RepID=A0A9X9MNH9_BLUGR|nr:Bgt-50294 [Blumeria graminis f. sp. tritici]
MAPPTTRSASSSDENSDLEERSINEPTLADILAEIRKLYVKQTSHDPELAELSVRFSEVYASVKLNKDSSVAVKNCELSDTEPKVSKFIDKPKGPTNFPRRDPLLIPGLKST